MVRHPGESFNGSFIKLFNPLSSVLQFCEQPSTGNRIIFATVCSAGVDAEQLTHGAKIMSDIGILSTRQAKGIHKLEKEPLYVNLVISQCGCKASDIEWSVVCNYELVLQIGLHLRPHLREGGS